METIYQNGETDDHDEDSPLPAALGLQRVGTESPQRPVPTSPALPLNRRGMPARIRKKNRLFFDDDVVNPALHRTSSKRSAPNSPNKRSATNNAVKMVTAQLKKHQEELAQLEQCATSIQETIKQEQLPTLVPSPDRRSSQRIGMRLRNLLKLPKAHKWVCYEWFYSNIDKTFFEGTNDFVVCLKNSFPYLKTRKLTRIEWCKIRRLMGKPRRCSQSFFEEERIELERKRNKVRMLQQRKTADFTNYSDLPGEIPLQLVIGTKVTARLRKPQDGLFTGSIDAVDTSNNTYRITFERPGLGTHSVPDYEVLSHEPVDTITVSSFVHKFRPPSIASFISATTRIKSESSPRFSYDPMLGSYNMIKSEPLPLEQVFGRYPSELLETIVRLSKVLKVKKEKINDLREMNAEAEMMKGLGQIVPKEFQIRYASTVLELENMNKDLQKYLSVVQKYCQQIPSDPGVSPLFPPEHLQETSLQEAKTIVQLRNNECRSPVKNERSLKLITQLTALLCQIKSLSEENRSLYEMQVLENSMEEIRSSLSQENRRVFQDSVEIQVQHIQIGLSQRNSSYQQCINQRC